MYCGDLTPHVLSNSAVRPPGLPHAHYTPSLKVRQLHIRFTSTLSRHATSVKDCDGAPYATANWLTLTAAVHKCCAASAIRQPTPRYLVSPLWCACDHCLYSPLAVSGAGVYVSLREMVGVKQDDFEFGSRSPPPKRSRSRSRSHSVKRSRSGSWDRQ